MVGVPKVLAGLRSSSCFGCSRASVRPFHSYFNRSACREEGNFSVRSCLSVGFSTVAFHVDLQNGARGIEDGLSHLERGLDQSCGAPSTHGPTRFTLERSKESPTVKETR